MPMDRLVRPSVDRGMIKTRAGGQKDPGYVADEEAGRCSSLIIILIIISCIAHARVSQHTQAKGF